MSLLQFKNLENLVIWYFFIIGLLGNLLTCYLIYRRISKFKSTLIKRSKTYSIIESTSKLDTGTILIHKNSLLDRRHNWNIYLYFMGINISDIIVLFSWLISKIEITSQSYSNVSHDLPNKNNIYFKKEDYSNFINSYSVVNSLNYTNNMTIDSIFENLSKNLRYIKIRLIDIQGVCQLNSYLITVSLQASYAYTVACILDRIIKMKVMNRDYKSIKNSSNKFQKVSLDNQSLRKKSSLTIDCSESRITKTVEFDNIKESLSIKDKKAILSLNLKRVLKSGHSDIVRQYFGKTSSLFIGVTIILFYYHLIWIYMLIENPEKEFIGEFSFEYLDNNLGKKIINGSIYANTIINRCQLPTFNVLPVLIQTMDVFFLLIMSLIKLILAVILLISYLKSEKLLKTSHESSLLSPKNGSFRENEVNSNRCFKSKYKDRYFLVKCILYMSIISTVLEMPSVIVRNILMMFFFVTLVFKNQEAVVTGNVFEQHNFAQNITQFNYNSSLNNFMNSNLSQSETESFYQILPQKLNHLCSYLDYLLLFTSSHKFMIFLFKCYFIKFSNFRESKSFKRKNTEK